MIRITGGELRGREIRAPSHDRTRPTGSKLRQALFNSLQGIVDGATVLDLFAGSGALGFEALSRGAARVVFVEASRPAARLIEQNARELGVRERVQVLAQKLGDELESRGPRLATLGPFDLVLADPPYAAGWERKLVADLAWGKLLVPGGRLCIEWGRPQSGLEELPERAGFLVKEREKNYGDSVLTTYVMLDPAQGPPEENLP